MSDDNNNTLDNLTEEVVEEVSTPSNDFDDFDIESTNVK